MAINNKSDSNALTPKLVEQLEVMRSDPSKTAITSRSALPLGSGQVRAKIDLFALTSNNVTYAVMGERLKYWDFFPALGGSHWGVVPVWGFAEVVESACEQVGVSERLYGYFPPSGELVLEPSNIRNSSFVDASDHRAHLAAGYNMYFRVLNEPGYNPLFDGYRALLQPLFLTSFVIWDYLKDNDWFGAEQIIVLSASSKTSIGTAYAVQADLNAPPSVGLTSDKNMNLVNQLGCYDTALSYDQLDQIDLSKPSVVVDMAGNAQLLGRVEALLGSNARRALKVGLTHHDQAAAITHVFKDNGEFFFAPSQIAKRIGQWGASEFTARSQGFVDSAIQRASSWMQVEQADSLKDFESAWKEMVAGVVDPTTGLVFSISQDAIEKVL